MEHPRTCTTGIPKQLFELILHLLALADLPWHFPPDIYRTDFLVRVYRTDKFNYDTDQVDVIVNKADGSLSKVSKTNKARLTPAYDDLSIFSLVNDTRVNVTDGANATAFMLLQKLSPGIYEIMFRAHYNDFPVTVNLSSNHAYWMSNTSQNFYFLDSTGTLITVYNISGSNRDFDPVSSNWSSQSLSPYLRTGNATSSEWGLQNVKLMDSAQAVWLLYGPPDAGQDCDDGAALFLYTNQTLHYVGDESLTTAYWLHPQNSWWVYANNYTIIVRDYLNGGQVLFNQTYTEAQFVNILSRYNLGAWVGPLVVILAIWCILTGMCAIFCRQQC